MSSLIRFLTSRIWSVYEDLETCIFLLPCLIVILNHCVGYFGFNNLMVLHSRGFCTLGGLPIFQYLSILLTCLYGTRLNYRSQYESSMTTNWCNNKVMTSTYKLFHKLIGEILGLSMSENFMRRLLTVFFRCCRINLRASDELS